MSDEEQSIFQRFFGGALNLSDSEREVPAITHGHVMRSAADQSVHDPSKLIDFAAYRQKARERDLMRGYSSRRPHNGPRGAA